MKKMYVEYEELFPVYFLEDKPGPVASRNIEVPDRLFKRYTEAMRKFEWVQDQIDELLGRP